MRKKRLRDAEWIKDSVEKLSEEILSREELSRLALIGIRTRGAVLAERIGKVIRAHNPSVPIGTMDITLYRDDLGHSPPNPVVRGTEIEFDVTDREIVLVDDVLFTGRTVRAALDQIVDFGRPRRIELAVLLDRGHRELPIQPDYVIEKIQTNKSDFVRVHLVEVDGVDEVLLIEG